MSGDLSLSPSGHLIPRAADDGASLPEAVSKRVAAAFHEGTARGLLHLATVELQTPGLPPGLAFARDFGRLYLTRLCQTPDLGDAVEPAAVAVPESAELAALVLHAPPLVGLEYLNPDLLTTWWHDLDELVRAEIRRTAGGAQAYLREKNPLWRLVGRVTFHLAENKRDPDHPFAFMATYASRLSEQGQVQHEPLGRALQQYAGAKNRAMLLSLLAPLRNASERSEWVKELVDSGDVYRASAWTPRDAYRFLQEIPNLETSGLIVRVPDWWKDKRPARPAVQVRVGQTKGASLTADSLLDFSVETALDGEPLSEAELQEIMSSEGGLVRLKGKWVEVDRDKLAEALRHWREVEQQTRAEGGLSFFEGMRLLAGARLERETADALQSDVEAWVGVKASEELERTLSELREPTNLDQPEPAGLKATLRPYQKTGVNWLRLVTGLGLGGCLADDMGLGKTIQVLALLLLIKKDREQRRGGKTPTSPSLLVVPASLIANWKAEAQRFAPSLSLIVAHPSEMPLDEAKGHPAAPNDPKLDLVITTYGMLSRLDWIRSRPWNLVILDEAQAIKNPGTRQTRAVNELKAKGRIALTGTPIENRLGDLWSLYNFLNPGLLGGSKAFADFVKRLGTGQGADYTPLRTLIKPYILRRLKTDKRVIADLPDKTELTAYCGLSKRQVVLYQQSVKELEERLDEVDGIQRRGLVLAQLLRLKQICNHPSQATGTGRYEPDQSGKFQRLAELCEELKDRQERALIFTQFREIAEPLAEFLKGVFGRPGLVLHGGTTVAKRKGLVEEFQREDGPPFFILSLKAGGTGLNLTAASHVIHFDRWWNPAVENQATDRAFRIGQRRKVFVHKFVCRGTLEERIADMIAQKSQLAGNLLESGSAEVLLTEMDNEQLLATIALDINKTDES